MAGKWLYTTDFHMLYHDAIDNDIVKENPKMIAQVLQQKKIEFYIENTRPLHGLSFTDNLYCDGCTMVTDTPTCWSFRKHWSSCSLRPPAFIYLPLLFPGSGIFKTYPGNRKRSRVITRFAY